MLHDGSRPLYEHLSGRETDRELIRLLQCGSPEAQPEAMAELYGRYNRYVMASLLRQVDEPTAEDLASEIFLRVMRLCHCFDTQNPGSSLKSWLSRVISNVVCDFYKKKHAEQNRIARYVARKAQTQADQPVDLAMVRRDQSMIVEEAMNRISEHMRQIAIDHFCNGAEVKELIKGHALPDHQIRYYLKVSFASVCEYINTRYRDSL